MEKSSVAELIAALNGSGARYLVAGGLAVVAHGYIRLTADVDIIMDLDDPRLAAALEALSRLGYKPRAPVALKGFADASLRARWIEEKGMTVFSLSSPRHPATEVDLFVSCPLDFPSAYVRASRQEVSPGVEAVFLGLDDLLRLKKDAGRPKDLDDIAQLNKIREADDGR